MVFRLTRMLMIRSYISDLHVKAASCETELLRLSECISDIDSWMSSNRLRMNADKTQFIWLGTKQQLAKIHCSAVNFGTVSLPVVTEVTCLGT